MLKNILKKVRYLEMAANNKIDSLFSGNYRSAFKGRGVEFADIRPYDSSDDARDIDWKTSSKYQEIFVKTYHESRDNTLFFLLDAGESLQFSSLEEKKYERLLETFSLLAFSAVKNGDKVGVLLYGDQIENGIKIFPPKKGKKNVLQILQYCIEMYSNFSHKNISKNIQTLEFSEVLKKTFSFLKGSSSVFWCTGEYRDLDTQLQKNIKIMASKHDISSFVFTDPLEKNLCSPGYTFLQNQKITFQDSVSGDISSFFLTPEFVKKFSQIRKRRQQAFEYFFHKQSFSVVEISSQTHIFKKLYRYFQKRQKMFL